MLDQESLPNRTAGDRPVEDHAGRFLDAKLWRQLSEAKTIEEFSRSWLGLQCSMIEGVSSSLVLLGPPDKGPFALVALWPVAARESARLSRIAQNALKERKGVVSTNDTDDDVGPLDRPRCHVAYPVQVDGELHGVVALEITPRPQVQLQVVMRQLQWGLGLLTSRLVRRELKQHSTTQERIKMTLDLAAATLEEERFQGAAMAFSTELASRLDCDRVSVGFMRGRRIKVYAVSYSAHFGKQMNLIRSIGSAMEECADQGNTLIYPRPPEQTERILREHEELARQHEDAVICTVPFIDRTGKVYGAMTLERSVPVAFDSKTAELCETVGALIAPILEEKRKNDRYLISKVVESFRTQLGNLIGPGHMAMKLVTAVLLALIVLFSLATGDYRVTADTTIEGAVQRAVVAPYGGYLDQAYARAGDVVRQSQIMCSLDDTDMRLERLTSASQREQHVRQYREAMAQGDRAMTKILAERINQSEAQLALLDEQIARAQIRAPFDGVVVGGDLSQSLGAPVERGQVLFEVAPLNAYRVILQVDERDIRQIQVGQQGDLVLTALPEKHWPVTVSKITPVSAVVEGTTYFRVEAGIEQTSEQLRPGMEGVGKILVDRRKLIWIWTHDLIDWARLQLWSLSP